jgi:hypothetical protein
MELYPRSYNCSTETEILKEQSAEQNTQEAILEPENYTVKTFVICTWYYCIPEFFPSSNYMIETFEFS